MRYAPFPGHVEGYHMPNLSTLQGQTALDVKTLRRDFPILARRVHDRPLVYLDSAASSQKPLQVLDAVRHYYQTSHANIHRGVYVLSEEATIAYEQAHERVAHFIHADWEEVNKVCHPLMCLLVSERRFFTQDV